MLIKTYNVLNIMNVLKPILLLIFMICFTTESFSQFTIAKDKSKEFRPKGIDSVNRIEITNDYFSPAKRAAEKRQQRKDRNYIEFIPKLSFNPIQAEYWKEGDVNSFTGYVHLYFKHIYTNNPFSFEYKFDSKYGLNSIDGDVFKNLDVLNLNAQATWVIKGHWSYAISSNFISQFSKGEASRTDDRMVSNFMSPGIVDVAGGLKYGKLPGTSLAVILSPIAGRIVVVSSDTLSNQGYHGVEKGKHTKTSLGSSLSLNFDRKFAKNKLRFRSELYSFTNWDEIYTARWKNTLDLDITKFLSTSLYLEMYYDDLAETPQKTLVAYYTSLTIALSYKFTNK